MHMECGVNCLSLYSSGARALRQDDELSAGQMSPFSNGIYGAEQSEVQ